MDIENIELKKLVNSKYRLNLKYIVDIGIDVKREYFGENFLTYEELMMLKDVIELTFYEKGFDITFDSEISCEYFNSINNVIFKKENNVTWMNEIVNTAIVNTIYDKDTVYHALCQIMYSKVDTTVIHSCDNCNNLNCSLKGKDNNGIECMEWSYPFNTMIDKNLNSETVHMIKTEWPRKVADKVRIRN